MEKQTQRTKSRLASMRMSARVVGDRFVVQFETGASNSWQLPERHDKQQIRQVRDHAMRFAKDNGGTEGQQNAVRKALTNAGYHLKK
jgi:hypothetical protein